MLGLMHEYANREKVEAAGLLDYQAIETLLNNHENPAMDNETKVQLDAMINHILGVQLLHHHFVAQDVPKFAAQRAEALNWTA